VRKKLALCPVECETCAVGFNHYVKEGKVVTVSDQAPRHGDKVKVKGKVVSVLN
jgi:hypothetical protein